MCALYCDCSNTHTHSRTGTRICDVRCTNLSVLVIMLAMNARLCIEYSSTYITMQLYAASHRPNVQLCAHYLSAALTSSAKREETAHIPSSNLYANTCSFSLPLFVRIIPYTNSHEHQRTTPTTHTHTQIQSKRPITHIHLHTDTEIEI